MSLVQKNVQLSEANVEAFAARFPKGNLSYTLDRLLEKFVAQYTLTHDDYVAIAAKELAEEIQT